MMKSKTMIATCVLSVLGTAALAGKPADGVSGEWRATYKDGEETKDATFFLGHHKDVVCGYYTSTKDGSGGAAGYVSLRLNKSSASGQWMESLQAYGNAELAFAGDKLTGGWAAKPEDTKLIPLTGTYVGQKSLGGSLTGKWEYTNSGGERCAMKLVQKGDTIEMSGTSTHDDSGCSKWVGTLHGNMLVGEWFSAASKDAPAEHGHFYAKVATDNKNKPVWMAGMEGKVEADGKPSCDSIGKITLTVTK